VNPDSDGVGVEMNDVSKCTLRKAALPSTIVLHGKTCLHGNIMVLTVQLSFKLMRGASTRI